MVCIRIQRKVYCNALMLPRAPVDFQRPSFQQRLQESASRVPSRKLFMILKGLQSAKRFSKRLLSNLKLYLPWVSNSSASPEPHPAAGRGVFDFILPVPPIRLFFATVDMCYLILWNFCDFLTFQLTIMKRHILSKHFTTEHYYSNNFCRSAISTKIIYNHLILDAGLTHCFCTPGHSFFGDRMLWPKSPLLLTVLRHP